MAVAALICSIASWVVCPVAPAVVALILASNARKKIAESGGRLDGEGLCTAATIVAWINIGAAVLTGIIVIIVAIATSSDTNTTFDLMSMVLS
jgi:hypothetical protein